MRKLLFILTLFISSFSFAQTDTTKVTEEEAYTIVEQMPDFPGGNGAMTRFIQENVKYPEAEKMANITGTCYINFIVEKDGTLSHIKVLRGVSGGAGCDKEALRVISMMPAWHPGKQNGNIVRTMFNVPIKFVLRDPK